MPSTVPAPVERARMSLWRGGGDVTVADAALPELAPGETLVRISSATLCGCVRRVIDQRRFGGAPTVLGHEGVGTVVATGSPVTGADGMPVGPGSRIVWLPYVACGMCGACASGAPSTCRGSVEIGAEPTSDPWQLSGSFASHVLLPPRAAVVTVPVWAPDALLSPAGCAITRAAAAVERAGGCGGKRVLVLGAGLIGLAVVAMAAESGAASCIVIDPEPRRRRRALEFGADAALAREARVPSCDVVIDVSGVGDGVDAALRALAPGGVLVLVGIAGRGALEVDLGRVAREAQTVIGVRGGDPRHLVQAADFLVSTHAVRPWTQLVGAAHGLEGVAAALAHEDVDQRVRISPAPAVAPGSLMPV